VAVGAVALVGPQVLEAANQARRQHADAAQAAREKRPPRRAPDPAERARWATFAGIVRTEAQKFRADVVAPLEVARDRALAAVTLTKARYNAHAAPIITAVGDGLIPFIVLMSVLAPAGVFLLAVIRELEIGVLKDLGMPPAKANLLGSIGAVALSVFGLIFFECMIARFAISPIRGMEAARRRALGALAGAAWVMLIIIAAMTSSARADARHGEALDTANANCSASRTKSAEAASTIVVCGQADRLQRTYERNRVWDETATVASALGEGIGAWALLRVIELAAAGVFAGASARHQRFADANTDRISLAENEFVRQMIELGERAGLTPEDILAAIEDALGADPDGGRPGGGASRDGGSNQHDHGAHARGPESAGGDSNADPNGAGGTSADQGTQGAEVNDIGDATGDEELASPFTAW
jgi:hypothetical protein